MVGIKVFINSVQREFADERQLLCQYFREDALLGRFFVPFIFALPFGLSPAKLKQLHSSLPPNPVLANPIYLARVVVCRKNVTQNKAEKKVPRILKVLQLMFANIHISEEEVAIKLKVAESTIRRDIDKLREQ